VKTKRFSEIGDDNKGILLDEYETRQQEYEDEDIPF
jgi:hypothetical protein